MTEKKQFNYIMSIHDALKLPSFFEDKNNLPKVNIVGIVVSIDVDTQISTVVIDDGSSSIVLRFFETNELLHSLSVGNIVKAIGNLRFLHNETYIVPDIIKKIDKHSWLEYRNLELKILKPMYDSLLQPPLITVQKDEQHNNRIQNNNKIQEESVVGDMIIEEVDTIPEKEESKENKEQKEKSENILDTILAIITKLDAGKGAAYDEIIATMNNPDCEKLLRKLIEQGEIFEIKPGRIKVL